MPFCFGVPTAISFWLLVVAVLVCRSVSCAWKPGMATEGGTAPGTAPRNGK